MEGLKAHLLQKDRKLIFGSDFIEVEIVGIAVDYLGADGLVLDLFDAWPVSLNHVNFSVRQIIFFPLFHYINSIVLWCSLPNLTPFIHKNTEKKVSRLQSVQSLLWFILLGI